MEVNTQKQSVSCLSKLMIIGSIHIFLIGSELSKADFTLTVSQDLMEY